MPTWTSVFWSRLFSCGLFPSRMAHRQPSCFPVAFYGKFWTPRQDLVHHQLKTFSGKLFERLRRLLQTLFLSVFKQLMDEVFVISGIIKVSVSVISLSLRLRLITLTETLIIPDITKTESNNCFIILYLQVISQFLAGSMKRIEKPFLLGCPRTWHCCPCTWHCSWKSCIACATCRLFTNL